jgi:hypothetical protein
MKHLISALFAVLLSTCVSAQDTRGRILGRVLDPSGALVANAKVEAVNIATNVASSVLTNSQGDYLLAFLLPGTYRLVVEKQGFRQSVRTGIEVQVNDQLTVDFTLSLGQVTDAVEVAADAPLLELASASSSQVIDNRRITELPLKDGNAIMLSALAPGVTNLTSGGVGRSRPFDNSSISSVGVNGVANSSNDFTLDGAPNTEQNKVALPPPAEIVQEFRIESASFDASQGFTPGAVINVSLKSGTNRLHAAAYYFNQNSIFSANSYFNNLGGQPKVPTYLHRYGANASGPVFIPKLYNGRNRTFWTYGYEVLRDYAPETPISTAVPTAQELKGDFSQLLALGPQYQIYDPSTIAPAGNGRFSRQPLPGNLIPANRISPLAAKIGSLWGPGNQPGTADGSANLYQSRTVKDIYWSQFFRVDQVWSDKHRMFVRGDFSKLDQIAYLAFSGANGEHFYRRNRGGALDDVYAIRPNILLNTRYSVTRFLEADNPVAANVDLSTFGFSSQFLQQLGARDPRGRQLPNINVSGYAGLADIQYNQLQTTIHSFAGSLTHIVGRHTMHYGAELRVYQHNGFGPGWASGTLSFDSTYTKGPLDNSSSSPMGQGLASFLLGIPSGGAIDTNTSKAQQSPIWGLYFGDSWKVTPKLTLTLGIRYELEIPTSERFNRSVEGFDFSSPNPIQAQAQASYALNPIPEIPAGQFQVKGGLTFAGLNGNTHQLWKTDRNNFMPRFGLAYAVDAKTVFRGGYGIFFDQLGLTRQQVNQTGFSRSTTLVPSTDNGLTFSSTLANPFSSGIDQPFGAALGLSTNLGQGVSFFNPNLINPYVQKWEASLQRQIWKDAVIEAAYIGNRATKLRMSQPLDFVPRQYLSTLPVRDQNTINFLTAQVANPFYPLLPRTSLSGATVARSQLLMPYPQFTGISQDVNRGYSWYHSLQARIEKRFSSGYTVNASYTWSKVMTATSLLNASDLMPERVIGGDDRTHRLVISGVWSLPVGKGQKLFSNARGIAGKLLSGWETSAIFQAQSGAPLGFGNSIFTGNLHDIPLSSGRSIYEWFNVDAGFNRNSSQQLSSNIRTLPSRFSGVRGPIMNNWDISAIKNTQVTEGIRLQFRSEFLNAFNHTQFDNPNTSPTSTAFGRITAVTHLARVIQFGLKLSF